MPGSMISAPTGGKPNVIGNNIAIVATVPIPGSTPTRVPTRAPSRQKKILKGLAATWNPIHRFDRRSDMTCLPGQKRGQSWNGRLSKYTNSNTQNNVIAAAAIKLSIHRISVDPRIEMMKARNVAGTRPSGRIMAADERIATMTNVRPQLWSFSVGGTSEKTPPTATGAPRAARTNENSLGAVPGPKAKPRCPGKSGEAIKANVANMTSASPP